VSYTCMYCGGPAVPMIADQVPSSKAPRGVAQRATGFAQKLDCWLGYVCGPCYADHHPFVAASCIDAVLADLRDPAVRAHVASVLDETTQVEVLEAYNEFQETRHAALMRALSSC